MKTFQVLLGCLLIIHLQYNAWAAPSQVDNTDYWETDVDNQDIHHRLEALEEYVEYQISEAVEGVTIIPTNQSHVINKRFDYFQYLRDTNFVECKCNLLKLHANIFSFINDRSVGHCSIRPQCQSMTDGLRQRYKNLEKPNCDDITFFRYFRLKIQSLRWADHAIATNWLCYIDRLVTNLHNLQALRWPLPLACPTFTDEELLICPTFTDEELLIIYDCNPDLFHQLETKLCIMFSFSRNSFSRHGSHGRDISNTQISCSTLPRTQQCLYP